MLEIISVSELTAQIKKQLESHFTSISVKGEISNFKEQTSGHLYFTLKDQNSQISAVLFRGNAKELSRMPKNGDQVILHGELNIYAPRGNYQIITRRLEFLGVGELLMQLHALKAKLEKQGWFEKTRKKPLPKFPRTIGVVTSATGSVIQDILQILERRFSGFHLILNPVKVQGEGAAEEIAKAIADFNRHRLADVLIVGRGGGSLEDLWAFNEEKVASAIFHSSIPVISAVGHETDFSIADFVADVRAPTPSAAAEIATSETVRLLQYLNHVKARTKGFMTTLLQHSRKLLDHFKRHPLLSSPLHLLEPHLQLVDDLRAGIDLGLKRNLQEKKLQLSALSKQMLALKPSNQIYSNRTRLQGFSRALRDAIALQLISRKKTLNAQALHTQIYQRLLEDIRQKKQKLEHLVSHLNSIDPKNLLTKGYCILFHEKKDSVILSTRELDPEDKVRLKLHDGQIHLTVNRVDQVQHTTHEVS